MLFASEGAGSRDQLIIFYISKHFATKMLHSLVMLYYMTLWCSEEPSVMHFSAFINDLTIMN